MIKIDKLTGKLIIIGIVGKRGNLSNNIPINKFKKKSKYHPSTAVKRERVEYEVVSDRTRNSWISMKVRCSKVRSFDTKNYGDRGITICERWMVYKNFLEDMGERPEGKTLDRINNNGNYEPSNCKWSTPREQVMNRRNTIHRN